MLQTTNSIRTRYRSAFVIGAIILLSTMTKVAHACSVIFFNEIVINCDNSVCSRYFTTQEDLNTQSSLKMISVIDDPEINYFIGELNRQHPTFNNRSGVFKIRFPRSSCFFQATEHDCDSLFDGIYIEHLSGTIDSNLQAEILKDQALAAETNRQRARLSTFAAAFMFIIPATISMLIKRELHANYFLATFLITVITIVPLLKLGLSSCDFEAQDNVDFLVKAMMIFFPLLIAAHLIRRRANFSRFDHREP